MFHDRKTLLDVAIDYKSYQSGMTSYGELNVKMSDLTW